MKKPSFFSKKRLNNQFLWHASLACFLLAGLTGFLYRLSMLGWIPGDLSLGNIRHAHSHLMFFGWAVSLPIKYEDFGRWVGLFKETVNEHFEGEKAGHAKEMAGKIASSFSVRMKMEGKFKDTNEHEE